MSETEYSPPVEVRTLVKAEEIPTSLVEIPQWVLWRYEPRKDGGKPHKTPYTPHGAHADVTNAKTWCSFSNALEAYKQYQRYNGIGFVLTKDTPIVGIDIDNCIEQGEYTKQAQEVIDLLQSYTEISPSKKGLRIFVEADLGDFAGRRRGDLELYSFGRYLTITGDRITESSKSIEPRLEELREMYKRFLADRKPQTAHIRSDRQPQPETPDDVEVLKHMFEGKLGQLYRDIYMGDIRNVHGQDESRADTLLFNGLAHYTKGNAEQMRRILASSPRYNQRGAKWHKKVSGNTTYLDYQIEDSIKYRLK